MSVLIKMTTLSKCPYCKQELDWKSHKCPHCWGVLLEVVGHKKETQKTNTTRAQDTQKTEYIDTTKVSLWKRLISIWKYFVVFLRLIWRYLKRQNPVAVLVGIIVLMSILISIFSNNDSTNTSSYNNTPKKVEEVILPENRLSNWTVIYRDSQYLGGDHEITIDNSAGGTDAIIKLVSTTKGRSIYTVYIREWYKYTIKNISNGNYYLYFAYCKWYNYGTEMPLWLYGSQKADRLYNLQTTRESDYLVSSQWTITLYKAYDGNLTTTNVWEDQFNSY